MVCRGHWWALVRRYPLAANERPHILFIFLFSSSFFLPQAELQSDLPPPPPHGPPPLRLTASKVFVGLLVTTVRSC